MKHLFAAMLLLSSLAAFAAEESVALNFKDVPVLAFVEATYKGILNRDYMISPSAIGMDSRITISMRAVERTKLPALVHEILGQVGLRSRDVDGMLRIERLPEPQVTDVSSSRPLVEPVAVSVAPTVANAATPGVFEEESGFEVYRPQYRTAEYLNAALRFGSNAAGSSSQNGSLDVVVVTGSEKRRKKIMDLLHELDNKPPVVNVRAALIEYSSTESDSFSVGGILSIMSGKLSLSMNASASNSNFLHWKTGSIDAVLGALAGDTRFRYRTQPSIRLVDGEQGRLQVGSDVPVRGNMTVTQNGQSVQSTEYKSSGVVLTVLPRILAGRIQARVTQEVSSFAKTDTSSIDSPTLNKRSIEATVDSEDGEVVVLAGLDEDSTNKGSAGLFSWLPLSRSSNSRTTQLVVLLEFKRI